MFVSEFVVLFLFVVNKLLNSTQIMLNNMEVVKNNNNWEGLLNLQTVALCVGGSILFQEGKLKLHLPKHKQYNKQNNRTATVFVKSLGNKYLTCKKFE